jgi:hypothetical protein
VATEENANAPNNPRSPSSRLTLRNAKTLGGDPQRHDAQRNVERGRDRREHRGNPVHNNTMTKISQTWLALLTSPGLTLPDGLTRRKPRYSAARTTDVD